MHEFGDNIMVVASDDKKKKGNGIASVLKLMQELLSFRDNVSACLDAQDIQENKAKLQECQDNLDAMYKSLGDIAVGAIGTMREKRGMESNDEKISMPMQPSFSPTIGRLP